MHGGFIVTVVFTGIVLALAIVAGTILMAIKIIKGGGSPKDQEHLAEEARMVQEMYQGLSGLEERLESLETILFDKEKKEDTP